MTKRTLLLAKQVVTYFLSLYLILSAVIPCTLVDDCEQAAHHEQTNEKDTQKDCSDCSPFSFCSPAQGFTINLQHTTLEPVIIVIPRTYNDFYISFCADYPSRLFQPPRIA